MKIHIVTHCINYSRLLRYHLSCFVKYPPKDNQVVVTIVYTNEDKPVIEVIDYFYKIEVKNVIWDRLELPKEQVCRRTIGRNIVALRTDADWVWFADVDYYLKEGCIDDLATILGNIQNILVYPKFVMSSKNHQLGDKQIKEAEGDLRVLDINEEEFQRHRYGRAIGGVQITKGDICREKGYLNGFNRYMNPVKSWARTKEDRVYRVSLGTGGTPIFMKNIFRIRHSEHGGLTGKEVYL